MRTTKTKLGRMISAALFLAIGFVLPLLTGQVKEIGDSLLPMHFPVMLCGLICGAGYGCLVGLVLPPFRSLIFGMPPIYPNAVWMALELATYGFLTGFLYARMLKKSMMTVYLSLLPAMIIGRIVWGVSKAVLLGLSEKTFTFSMFIAGGFVDAVPGIILQLVLIPLILKVLSIRRITK